jgi:hypothetical protein
MPGRVPERQSVAEARHRKQRASRARRLQGCKHDLGAGHARRRYDTRSCRSSGSSRLKPPHGTCSGGDMAGTATGDDGSSAAAAAASAADAARAVAAFSATRASSALCADCGQRERVSDQARNTHPHCCQIRTMSVARMAATSSLRSALASGADRLRSRPARCSSRKPMCAWWFSSTLVSLYRSASGLAVLTWYALVVPGCSRSWQMADSSSASASSGSSAAAHAPCRSPARKSHAWCVTVNACLKQSAPGRAATRQLKSTPQVRSACRLSTHGTGCLRGSTTCSHVSARMRAQQQARTHRCSAQPPQP